MGDYNSAMKTLSSLRQGQADKKSELKLIAKELKFFKDHDECPTCSQQIEPAFKNAVIGANTGKGKLLPKKLCNLTPISNKHHQLCLQSQSSL